MFATTLLPAGRFEAGQDAIRAKSVEKLAVHGWRRARAGIIGVLIGTTDHAQLHRPEAAAIFDGKRQREFVSESFVAEEIDPPARHGRGGKAGTDIVCLPEQLR